MYPEMGVSVSGAGAVSMTIAVGTIVSSLLSDRLTCRFRHFLITTDPLSPAGNAVESPMDEHTKPRLLKPRHTTVVGGPIKSIHFSSPQIPI
jgi:hypothetical protein